MKKETVNKAKASAPAQETEPIFGKMNYILLLAGLVLLILGYLLMIGGESKDPAQFSYAIFDFQRLTLSPILLLAGFIVEVFAILYKRK